MANRFTASAYLIHEETKSVLLVLHRRFNEWVPVGGGREGDERPADIVQREVKEETGIEDAVFVPFPNFTALPGTPLGFLGYHEHDVGNGSTHLNFAFAMKVASRKTTLCDEHLDAKWFTEEDLESSTLPMPPNVRRIMELLFTYSAELYSGDA
jgi:8-oxo-dGTP pyrophosphatase MutT (NUDIX family)